MTAFSTKREVTEKIIKMRSFRFHGIAMLTIIICSLMAVLFWCKKVHVNSNLLLQTSWSNTGYPNIVLIETKIGKRYLSARDACVLESAAMQHPYGQVTLYNVNGPMNVRDEYVTNLVENYSNIFFRSLHLEEAFANTPLEQWHQKKKVLNSEFPIVHLSDALRLAILWKTGGVYLDTDCLVVKDMTNLNNAVGYEIATGLAANGVLIFPKQSPFINLYMQTFADHFNGSSWHGQGGHMLTKLLQKICNTSILRTVIDSPYFCGEVMILPNKIFYPIPWTRWRALISKNQEDYSASYSVHLYGSLSRNYFVEVGDGSFLEILFQRHCPKTYQLILDLKMNLL